MTNETNDELSADRASEICGQMQRALGAAWRQALTQLNPTELESHWLHEHCYDLGRDFAEDVFTSTGEDTMTSTTSASFMSVLQRMMTEAGQVPTGADLGDFEILANARHDTHDAYSWICRVGTIGAFDLSIRRLED